MRICVATGTRAEYGLLKPLIDELKKYSNIQVQLLVTGTHLSPEFGLTYTQIERDEFIIDSKVEMLLSSDTAEGITKSMGLGMIGFSQELQKLKPDLLVILGDRFEMLSLASTALIFKIPIAHLHGGEITEGAYDDAIRHAITKLSHLHFTSTETYKNRVIQLGEHPETVFNVGAIGIDNVQKMKLLSRTELENELQISFGKWNYIVAFHPETLKDETVELQFMKLLSAIDRMEDSFFIFTKANADTGGRIINELMGDFVKQNSTRAVLFDSLGSLRYLSVVHNCTALVGNSSSGILEAPALDTPSINIGDRQKGRIMGASVLSCSSNTEEILKLMKRVQDNSFIANLFDAENPYGIGVASEKIARVLNDLDVNDLGAKKFYNLNSE